MVKVSTDNNPVSDISDTDVGLLRLQQNEQALTRTMAKLEDEKQEAEQEARAYIRKGMRQAVNRFICSSLKPVKSISYILLFIYWKIN